MRLAALLLVVACGREAPPPCCRMSKTPPLGCERLRPPCYVATRDLTHPRWMPVYALDEAPPIRGTLLLSMPPPTCTAQPERCDVEAQPRVRYGEAGEWSAVALAPEEVRRIHRDGFIAQPERCETAELRRRGRASAGCAGRGPRGPR